MPQARGSLRQIAYIPETVLGTTPGTPQTQLIEYVDFKGTYDADEITDPSINAFRQKTFSRTGNVSATAELEVVLAPDNFDAFLEAVLMGEWATNVLKVGTVATAVRKSFSIEEGFTDLVQYRVFKGMVVNSMTLNFATDGLVTGSFGFLGTDVTTFTGTTLDATPTAVTTKPKFYHDGGTFQVAGATVGWMTSLELTVENGYEPTNVLGTTIAADIPFGTAKISGKVTGLFDSVTELNKFKAGTASSISALVVADAESLTFLLPQIKYISGDIVSSGDAGVVVEFTFEAEYHPASESSMVITRA